MASERSTDVQAFIGELDGGVFETKIGAVLSEVASGVMNTKTKGTGCEHPLTYRFIREVVKFWDIPLTVLQVDINPELGQPNGYTEWEPKDIQTRMPVLKPFMDMVKKYGTPYIGGAFCTDRLKLIPFTKYCDNHFGRGNYITWLGIRADEPSRLKPKSGVRYLAELSDFDKSDVIRW